MVPLSVILPLDSIRYPTDELMHWRWYLAILGCEHVQRPGHLLGRVCYIHPSDSGVEFLYPGSLFIPESGSHISRMTHDLIPLSPETIERCRPHIEPSKTVYIPHPDRHDTPLRNGQPQHTISLLLLTGTRKALHAKGYTADLRRPEPLAAEDPTTHQLLIDNLENSITVDFRHTLNRNGGGELIVNAVATLRSIGGPGFRVHDVEAATALRQADPRTVSWTHKYPWYARLEQPQGIAMRTGTGKRLTMELSLNFVCIGAYRVHVDIRRADDVTPPPSPPLAPAEPLQGEGDSTRASGSDAGRGVRDVDVAEEGNGDRLRVAEGTGDGSGGGNGHRSAVDAEGEAVDVVGVREGPRENLRGREGRTTRLLPPSPTPSTGEIRRIGERMMDAGLKARARRPRG